MKIYTGNIYLLEDEGLVEVHSYNPNKKLKKGHGYIIDEYVLIYRGKKNKLASVVRPGVYKLESGRYQIIYPTKESDIEKYSIENILDLNMDTILETDPEERLNELEMEIINNNKSMYTPTIKDDDDFLKRAVKQVIIDKGINLKNYKDKFPKNGLNNFRSGLDGETKLTTPKFETWMEIMGCKFTLIVEDNGGDPYNSLNEPIIIKSE